MIYILLYLLTLSVAQPSDTIIHEFHISKTEVEYKSEERVLQISSHIFIDDLELALAKEGYGVHYLFTEKESIEADSIIADYVNDQLSVSYESYDLELTMIGKEMSEDLSAVWCYFLVEEIPDNNNLSISNRILLEQFDDQKNITVIKKDGHRLAHWIFDEGYYTDLISLKN